MTTFSYGCWITGEGPEKGCLVKLTEEKFVMALKEALAIAPNGDVGRAVDIIKAAVSSEMRKSVAARR